MSRVFASDGAQRALLLLFTAMVSALLLMSYSSALTVDLRAGAVAPRDVRAPTAFSYIDWEATEGRQRTAEDGVLPVYDYDNEFEARLNRRVSDAFAEARQRHADAMLEARNAGRKLTPSALEGLNQSFADALGVSPTDLGADAVPWSQRTEALTLQLISLVHDRYIIADKGLLPSPPRPITVLQILPERRSEVRLDTFDAILDPETARQLISLHVLEGPDADAPHVRTASALARASIRANFSYNQLLTGEQRREARQSVAEVISQVQEDAIIVRKGDVVTRRHVEMVDTLRATQKGLGGWAAATALMAFCALIILAMYQFSSGYIRKFSIHLRDLQAMAWLTITILVVTRVIREASTVIAPALGNGLVPSSLWYLAPIAGGTMLVRILINSETALVFTVVVAGFAGVMLDQDVLMTVFFIVTGVSAAGGVAYGRERVNVLRAGLQTGLIAAAAALLIDVIRVNTMGPLTDAQSVQVLWDMSAALLGGIGGAILVLGFVPLFEVFGFVTDYKLLELANLNHPLLRNLMLRAPGTYHHSVIVGSLSEAAAEAIGCNALLARVCCYFHDIGKAVQPHYYIENQRDAPNRHNRLAPEQSARIIISHVVDGAAIAEQYKLPKPVIDSIRMHHGTGIIQYFYAKALEAAEDTLDSVDPAHFRYPGPRPDSREMGIIMLADKVEAACRSIKDPTEEKIRGMIQKLVNDTIVDGQLEDCPLTLKELYTVMDTFTNVILGIYHQRIEYPGIPKKRPLQVDDGEEQVPRSAIITLEVPNPLGLPPGEADGSPYAEPKESTGPIVLPKAVDEA